MKSTGLIFTGPEGETVCRVICLGVIMARGGR